MGEWEKSIKYMKQVIKLNPKNASALNFVGYTYAENGVHLEEAQRLIESALKLKPDDGFIIDSLGWIYFQRGNVEEALKLLEKADKLAPNEPTILEHLGDVYLSRKNKRLARKFFERSMFEINKKKELEPREQLQLERIQQKIGTLL